MEAIPRSPEPRFYMATFPTFWDGPDLRRSDTTSSLFISTISSPNVFNSSTDDQSLALYHVPDKSESEKLPYGKKEKLCRPVSNIEKQFQEFGIMEKEVWNKKLFLQTFQVVENGTLDHTKI